MYTLYYDDGNLRGFLQRFFIENGEEVLCLGRELIMGEWLLFETQEITIDFLNNIWKNPTNKRYVSVIEAPIEILELREGQYVNT